MLCQGLGTVEGSHPLGFLQALRGFTVVPKAPETHVSPTFPQVPQQPGEAVKFVPKPGSMAGFFIVAARHFIMGLLNGLQKHMWLKPPSALEELCGAPPHNPGSSAYSALSPAQLQAGQSRSFPSRQLQQLPGHTATPREGRSCWKAQP